MTEEQIKEKLSTRLVQLIGNRYGYEVGPPPGNDTGIDLQVIEKEAINQNGKKRYTETGYSLNLQLKCTALGTTIVAEEEDNIRYDLKVNNFNDLVRKRSQYWAPLYLVLVVLPPDESTWISQNDGELILKGNAYWYIPEKADIETGNSGTKRIRIPKNQVFSHESIVNLLNKMKKKTTAASGI